MMGVERVLLVGLGGFVGAVLRYVLGGFVHRYLDAARFPYGTLTVNLAGCLAIGFVAGRADARGAFTPESRVFVFVGVIGAFTTFSTFGYETTSFLRDGQGSGQGSGQGAGDGVGHWRGTAQKTARALGRGRGRGTPYGTEREMR